MKRTLKKVSKFMVAMLGLSVVPGVYAQEDNTSLYQELAEANKDYVSQAFDYNSSVYLEVNDQKYVDINAKGEGKYNVDPQFSGEATLNLNGEVSQETPQAPAAETTDAQASPEEAATQESSEVVLEPISFTTQMVVLDNIFYALDGETWKSQDVAEELKEISKSIDEAKAQINVEQIEALNEKMAPYMDVNETDTEYVVTMKKDIDSEKFWADVNEVIDIEAMKAQAIKEAEKQAADQGVEFTDAQRDQVNYYVDKGLAFALDMISNNETHYDKESKKLTKTLVNIELTEEDIAKIVGMDKEALGVTVKANIDVEINYSNHGETFDIQVPEGATAPESRSQEQSSEVSDKSEEMSSEELSEDSSAEETSAQGASEDSSEQMSEETEVEETTAA